MKLPPEIEKIRDELVKDRCVFPWGTHDDDDYRTEYFTQGFDACFEIMAKRDAVSVTGLWIRGAEILLEFDGQWHLVHRGNAMSHIYEPLGIRMSGIDPKHTDVTDLRKERDQLRDDLDTERLRLAACGAAALCNTEDSAKRSRIDSSNPYWSASYGDVCAMVDREMQLRADLDLAIAALVDVCWCDEIPQNIKSNARIYECFACETLTKLRARKENK